MEFNFGTAQQPNTASQFDFTGGFNQQIGIQPKLGAINPGIAGAVNPTIDSAASLFDAQGKPAVPGAGGGGGKQNNPGFLQQGGGLSTIFGGLETIGSLFSSFSQNRLANKSIKLQERAFDTNLRFNTKQANNSLEDRIRTRFATEGRSEQADAKIAEQRLVI